MRLLLDTNAFLWWVGDDARLGAGARDLLSDPATQVFVSAATAWEISIKHAKGKLPYVDTPAEIAAHRFEPLAIDVEHGVAAGELPAYHRDPFDRVLVAQARSESLTLLTADEALERYDVALVRADR